MKLRIASDLHLEFYTYKSPYMSLNGRDINEEYMLPTIEGEHDQTLILAGDVCCAKQIDRFDIFFDKLSKRFKNIIMIMGNHEHYNNNFKTTYPIIKSFLGKWTNIHFLEKEHITLDDVMFFGATFWTDFNKGNPLDMMVAKNAMPDFRIVGYGAEDGTGRTTVFTPELALAEHYETMAKLRGFIKLDIPNKKKVVISHHCPSYKSISPQFKNSPLNPAFQSDLEADLEDSGIALWVHGHVHQNFDYVIDKTQVVCNPFAYWGENPSGYKRDLVLTV